MTKTYTIDVKAASIDQQSSGYLSLSFDAEESDVIELVRIKDFIGHHGISDVLSEIDIDDIVSNFDQDDILKIMNAEYVKQYFGLVEE